MLTFNCMILITGSTGLVGSHLLAQLVAKHPKIRATKRASSDLSIFRIILALYYPQNSAEMEERIQWVTADLTDIPALTKAFEGISKVYHCAAYISFDPKNFYKLKKANIEGTANVVNLCLKNDVEKLIHVSSIATLGEEPNNKPMDETSDWNPEAPNSVYAITKYGAEMEVWRGQQEGLATAIVNPGVIIGPGNWNSGSCVIFKRAARGIPRYTTGSSGFVGVWDVVKAMQLLMNSDLQGQRYVLVAENRDYKQFIIAVCNALGAKVPKKPIGRRSMLMLAVLDYWRSKLFGGKQKLIKDTVESLYSTSNFNGKKALEIPGFEYQDLEQAIKKTAEAYSSEVLIP